MKRKTPINDPHGGLTPAVRAEFARKDGTRLKPGMHLRQGTTYPPAFARRDLRFRSASFGLARRCCLQHNVVGMSAR
jgi:hypothetical protein